MREFDEIALDANLLRPKIDSLRNSPELISYYTRHYRKLHRGSVIIVMDGLVETNRLGWIVLT